jgi:hypothetical protein
VRFGPPAPMACLKQLILWGWGIVRYKVTREDPHIPTEIRETPQTGLNLRSGQTSDFSENSFKIRLMNLFSQSLRERRKHYGSGLSEDCKDSAFNLSKFQFSGRRTCHFSKFPDL